MYFYKKIKNDIRLLMVSREKNSKTLEKDSTEDSNDDGYYRLNVEELIVLLKVPRYVQWLCKTKYFLFDTLNKKWKIVNHASIQQCL